MATTKHIANEVIETMDILVNTKNAQLSHFASTASETDEETRFDKLLHRNIESAMLKLDTVTLMRAEMERIVSNNCESSENALDVRWQYTLQCLQLLDLLLHVLPNQLEKRKDTHIKHKTVYSGDKAHCLTKANKDQMKSYQEKREGAGDVCQISAIKRKDSPSSKAITPDKEKNTAPNRTSEQVNYDFMLSMGHKKTIAMVTQFVVCLGVYPNLEPGVGIPFHFRSDFANSITSTSIECLKTCKIHRLTSVAKVFMSCIRNSALSSEFVACHLSDVLSVLLQLGYSSTFNTTFRRTDISERGTETKDELTSVVPGTSVDVHTGNDSPDCKIGLKSRESDCMLAVDEVEYWRDELRYLVDLVYKPLLVKELLLLQGGPNPKMLKKQLQIPQSVNKSSPLAVSPSWLRRSCGRMLTEILLGCHGIRHILQGMLGDDIVADNTASIDWRKYDAVAMVIANCPYQADSLTLYYKNVASQIVDLLHKQDTRAWRHFIRVASGVIGHMTRRHYDLTCIYIMAPILSPFMTAIQEHKTSGVIVKVDNLAQCIEDVYQIFVLGEMKTEVTLSLLQPVIVVVFQLYAYTFQHSVSVAYRSWLEAILLSYIKNRDVSESLAFLHSCVTLTSGHLSGTSMCLTSCFTCDDSGSVAITGCEQRDEDTQSVHYITAVLDLLSKPHDSSLISLFFISLLRKVQEIVETEATAASEILTHVDNTLGDSIMHSLCVLNAVAAMCERFEASCLRETKYVIDFVQVTLTRCVSVCATTQDIQLGQFETETLNMALGLLVAILSNNTQLTDEEKCNLKELLPLLESIQRGYHDDEIINMMTALRIAIATHGFVLSEDLFHLEGRRQKPHIEVISSGDVEDSDTKRIGNEREVNQMTEHGADAFAQIAYSDVAGCLATCKPIGQRKEKTYNEKDKHFKLSISNESGMNSSRSVVAETNKTILSKNNELKAHIQTSLQSIKKDTDIIIVNENSYTNAMEEIHDTMIPIKGHGLLRLTKLIQSKDEQSLQHIDSIMKTLLENLSHDDTYIYLGAINGLSALADCSSEEIIQCLVTEFVDCDKRSSTDLKLKLGEVLMKATRNLGDLVPAYRDLLLPAFLHGARSHDPSVRSSSLSNLSEVCRLLRFSLSSHLQEIVACCSQTVKTEADCEVRKAAAMVLCQLIEGTGPDLLQILGETNRDVYRLLKFVQSTERDDTVLLHVNIALNELDEIMKHAVFPRQHLVKKINILGHK